MMDANTPSLESNHCWDNANGSCAPLRNSWDYGSIPAKLYLAYMLLVTTGALSKLIDAATSGRYTERLSKYVFREIFWVHGMATYTIMCIVQPHNLRLIATHISGAPSDVMISILKYSLKSILAFLLWDVFIVSPHSDAKSRVYINTHHLGLFIAMYFGSGWEIGNADETLKKQAQLDSCLYGWMWAIHSFGFILKHIFPLFGINLRDGERSTLLDNIKYAYSSTTVYWYYWYFNAESQPGVGFNYQTMSLLTMLIGRFLPNGRIDFLRRAEMPGLFIILVDGLFFKDDYLQRSIGIAILMLGAWALYYCCMKKHTQKPIEFYGPGDNVKLKEFLVSESEAVNSKEEKENTMRGMVKMWFEGELINVKKHAKKEKKDNVAGFEETINQLDPLSFVHYYPLHYAVVKGDANKVEQILQTKKVDVNERLLEHKDSTPLQFAAWFAKHGCGANVVLALLKHGGNPYIKSKDGRDTIESFANTSLGNSQDFFKRYNEICLERAPPKVVFSELSVLDKIRLVPV